jgi:hypothetical protein
MVSATETFPDAGKMLFGQSFEEKIKQRNGAVKIISATNAKKPNQQFFEGGFLQLPSMARGMCHHAQTFHHKQHQQ